MEKRALGKGLGALIMPTESQNIQHENILQVPVAQIKTNKYQPRIDFNKEKLEELIGSIKEKGIVQPVLVRNTAGGYELIAGERRLRAVKALGYEKIPAIVRNVNDVNMLEISLIENIQREELNPMEEASAFQKLIADFSFTQEKIAKAVSKDRSTVANTLRLLNLPKKIRDYISDNSITAGHARAILSLPTEMDQLRVCNLVVKKGLSVRETENIVTNRSFGVRKNSRKADNNMLDIETGLQQALGTRVKIHHGKKRGRIIIEYYSTEDLNRILGILTPKKP
jgi:ParB family chromosome partitioning protein